MAKEATSGRLAPSEGAPKGIAPLRLGTAERVDAVAREVIPGERAALELPSLAGMPTLALSKRGAGHLGRWLLDWSRPRAKLKLWGIGGIVKECKISRGTAYNWIALPTFPKPLDMVGGNGPVWEADAVKAWVRLERPTMGRPRKQKGRAARS